MMGADGSSAARRGLAIITVSNLLIFTVYCLANDHLVSLNEYIGKEGIHLMPYTLRGSFSTYIGDGNVLTNWSFLRSI